MMHILICIPTRRQPPLQTLEAYVIPDRMEALIIADPSVHRAHCRYDYPPNITVVKGREGIAGQVTRCYIETKQRGFTHFFRLDDDLGPRTFVHRDGYFPKLSSMIRWAEICMKRTHTTLVGFSGTSRRDWMSKGYGRSYTLIWGGAQLVKAIDPKEVLDPKIERYEDCYRSCAHRKRDGAVGRVKFVGVNRLKAQSNTAFNVSQARIRKSVQLILKTFPDCIKLVEEEKSKQTGLYQPKWRYIRHPGYTP